MAVQIQVRRGSTAEHSTFTGAVGEITMDTTKNVVVVHNGSIVGGFPLALASGSAITAASLLVNNNLNISTGNAYQINGVSVLNATTLGSGVTASSLTSVGTLASLTVTGAATAGKLVPTANTVTGNGMYLPTTNVLAFSTDGTERMRIDASGNVLIGAGKYLGFSATAYMTPEDNIQGARIKTGGAFIIETGGTEKVKVDTSGNLLLNGASVSAIQKFSGSATGMAVQGAVPAFALVDHNDTTNFVTYLGNTEGVAYLVNVHASSPFIFGTNDTERARITAGGYFKASDAGTYLDSTGAYHELRTSTADTGIAVFSDTSSSPYGISIQFLGAAPNNTTNFFFRARDNASGGTDRAFLYSNGDWQNANGVYGTLSDAKLKQDITDAASQWDDLKAVRFRKYRFISDVEAKGEDAPYLLGVVAQELQVTSPGLVDSHPDTEQVEVEVEVEKSRPVMHEVEEVVTDAEGVESVVMKSVPMLDEEGKEITETYTETETRTETRKTGTETLSVKQSILLMKAAVALQEAIVRIESLEARLDAQEN